MSVNIPPPADAKWAYFLDVDGTLINIADTPDAVRIDKTLLDLIGRLYRATGGAVALVSGRSIADLDQRLAPLRLPTAGQHGLERRDPDGHAWTHVTPPGVKDAIKAALTPVLARHPGLLLEEKGVTLALHYRQAPRLASYAHRLMADLARDSNARLEVQRGKRVAEIKPSGFDKGTAISAFLSMPPFQGRRPVFIGDDANDEHGFAEVNRIGGISIRVGPGRSCARYRLANVAGVRSWLNSGMERIE
jgi:trehalose 6-phosphate phosphatase